MEEKNTNDVKPDDFEMGGDSSETPKINNYTQDLKPPQPTVEKPPVEPQSNQLPPETPISTPPESGRTIGQVKNNAQPQAVTAASTRVAPVKPVNVAARKKAVIGCLGGFGAILLIFLTLAFIFISQSDQTAVNPIARLLNLNQASFVNGLITLVHIIFILASLIVFVFTMIGLFKASMAKREDKEARKQGLRMTLISGIVLFFILIVWGFVYIYLDGKRVNSKELVKAPIITEPEETLNLTAPIDIRFDASNVTVGSQFQILSYDWDFGDGAKGTSQIVSHTYEEKGLYDVTLSVTKQNKKTGEKVVDSYTSIVSIQNEALSAIMEVDKQNGSAPLEVEFSAAKSADPDGTISTYEWDFNGDGDFSDAKGKEVKHVFDKIGKYNVALRVISNTGEYDIAEKEIVVEEAKIPQVKITVADEPQSFTTGVQYIFQSESTSPNGSIEKYSWDFGDGTKPATTKNITHSFAKEGTYQVTLKVTDKEGEDGEGVLKVVVGAPQGKPKAKIETTPSASAAGLEGEVPLTVVFDASGSTDSDNNIVEYNWDLDGDGKADQFAEKVSYTYSSEGTYTAKLTVVDSDDNFSTATVIVKVKAQGIKAALKADKASGTAPVTIKFDASGSTYQNGEIASYQWDFGDGTPTVFGNAISSHKYTEIGNYTVKVTVVGSDNTKATAVTNVSVREVALSACFVSVFENGPAPLTTSFDPGCTTGTVKSYFWNFGDGQNSSSVTPSHTFVNPGVYTVTLEVTDANNTVSEAQVDITVNANE